MKSIKPFLFGYLFGFGLTWLLYIVFTMAMGKIDLVINHAEEILQQSLIWGIIGMLLFGVIGLLSKRQREKRELEEAMRDYFLSQTRKEEER
jgi:hypothetical protein